MPVPINPKTVRYTIAQFFLRALYGRKWHYISPWKHASIAATVVLVKDGKVLMGKRRGNIEYVGLRDHPGGHVDLEFHEEILQAAVRETFEETGMQIDISKMDQNKPIDIFLNHDHCYIEHTKATNLCLTYVYSISDEELKDLKETKEAHDFKWFNKAEVKAKMQEEGMHIIERRHYERALKALENVD